MDFNDNIQSFQLIMSQYVSPDAMIEAYSKDSVKLLNLFEVMTRSENTNNSEIFNKIFKKIELLDSEGKLNETQIQKIISVISKVYPNIKNEELRITSLNFSFSHINDDNIYMHLKFAKEQNNHDYIKKCLDSIENKCGIKINSNSLPININVSDLKISYEQLSKEVLSLSNIFEDQIAITLVYQNNPNSSDFLEFLKTHGEKVNSLNLTDHKKVINDILLAEILKFCPNLCNLCIINCPALKELPKLPTSLTVFELIQCHIEELPNLPAGLTTLDIRDCQKLKKLPHLPGALTNLKLLSCNCLEELPDLPKDLAVIQIFYCRHIKNLPDLPTGLKELNLNGSSFKLPNFPAGLTILKLAECSGFKALPKLPAGLTQLEICNCKTLEWLASFPTNLTNLKIQKCDILKELPNLPKDLGEFNISKCPIAKLPNLPVGLTTLVIQECNLLEQIPKLPAGLTWLDISRCRILKKIPNMPAGLKGLTLFGNESIKELRNLPAGLTTLDLASCSNLVEVTNFPSGLTKLDLNGCYSLEEVPDLPIGLTSLNFRYCQNLKMLPNLPSSLTTLDLGECENLSDDYRSQVLSSVFAQNFDQGLKLFQSFSIKDNDKLFKFIAEKYSGEQVPEGQDCKLLFVNFLERKLSDEINPQSSLNMAKFILDNQLTLRLHDEHPLIQNAIEITSISAVEGEKNPFSLFKKLKELSQTSSEFIPQPIEIDGISIAINMDQLAILSRGAKITREELPENVSREAFDRLSNSLKFKIENNPIEATNALESLGTTWAEISVPIFDDPKKHLAGLLDRKGANVSEIEAKWRKVLSNILNKSQVPPENSFFSEQEEVFIKTMMGIQNCEGGKDVGISLSYELLDPSFRYQIALSKAMTIEQGDENNKAIEAKNFVRNYIEEQKNVNQAITNEMMALNLVDVVNKNLNENSEIIYSLIDDQDYWKMDEDSGDMLLNIKGALKLVTMVLDEAGAEKNQLLIDQFIGQAIQKLIATQFTGTNLLMEELTGVNDIQQGAHQGIYLKNLIGYLVGISQQGVVFDRHAGTIYNSLIDKNRDEVLKIFFKFVTPDSFMDEIMRVVNENIEENKRLLMPLLGDDFWKNGDANGLSRKGALTLLEKLGYLKRTLSKI